MADRISSIYEKACAKGILDPQTQSEQWFRDQLSTEQGVKSFYDHATANGMKFHPYPEFKERLTQPINEQPAQPAQPANPRVKDYPAPTTEEEYQRNLEQQDIASGVAHPLDDEAKAQLRLRQQAFDMGQRAEQMGQRLSQPAQQTPQMPTGPIAESLQKMQRERLPEIRKQTIAKNMLDETYSERNAVLDEIFPKEEYEKNGAQRAEYGVLAQNDPYLKAADNILMGAQIRMSDAKRQNGVSWSNVGNGLVSFAKDATRHLLGDMEGTLSFGTSDLRDAMIQRQVLKKIADAEAYDNPEQVLTPQEKVLYDAIATNIAVEIARKEDTSRWSSAGKITADMIPFVADIMAGNALFKGMGNVARKAITQSVEKAVKNKLAKWLLINVPDVAISAGESALTATILPRTYAKMYENAAQVDMNKVGMDGDYRLKIGGVDQQSMGKSWAQAEGEQIKEIFTETGGNFRLIGRALIDNPIGKKILKTPFGMVLKRFEGAQGGAGSRFASMTMYHGVLGEWLEELEGAIYDGNLKDFFTADTQLPMLLSFSVPAAFTGGLNATQQAFYQAKYDQAGKRIDKLIDASSYLGPDKNTIKGQILATLYQTPTENLPQAIGMCVEQVYPEEYKALMEGAPEKGNKAAELSYALKEYLTSGTVLTIFDPDMIGGQIADVQAHRQQMRQQAEQNAQAEVQSISHEDGNIYRVSIKGKDGAEGYAFRGDLDVVPNQDGTLSTRGRDLITIKMTDGTVEQVPADEVTLLDAPASAADRVQAVADHLFAQYANNDLFQIGDKVHIMQDGQPSEDSSTIVGINDEGVEVEIIDPNGQPNTTIIPHEQAAEMLSKDETGTEDGIVTYTMQDGNTIRLRDMGNGVYNTIVPDGEQPEIFTEEELAEAGAVRAESQTEALGSSQTEEQAPTYPQDETGNPAWGQMEVPQSAQVLYDLYKGNRESAKAYADDQLKEAQKVQKAAAKQASHNLNLAQRLAEEEQNAQFKAQADAAVKYWEDVKLAIAQIKTAEEQAAQAAQLQLLQQAREQRSKTEEGTVTAPTMAERYAAADKIEGNTGTMTLPDGRELSGRYMLIAPQGVTPSHDVTKNFQRSEGYPVTSNGQSINDRDYTSDQEEQQKVQSIAQNFNGNAIKNMPVISDEGLVYNGNGRMMAGQLAALNGTDAAYTQSLMNNAAQYGFTPEQVASIPHARVVFQLDERLPYSTQSLAIFNEQETQTQSNTGKAAGYARKLTPQAVSEVLAAVDGFNTIDAFFSDKKAPFNLINSLINSGIIAQREKAEMVDGDKLSATGRERLSNILFGTVFDNETIRLMGDDAALKNSIMRALPQILDNKSLGEFSLEADINDAIRLLYQVRNSGMPFRSFVSQTVIAEDGQVHTAAEGYSPFQLLLAEEMSEGGVDAFRDVLTAYNNEARNVQGGQVDIFGDLLTPTELKNLILQRYGKEPNEQERPSASRQTDNSAEGTPASNEPAAEQAITLTDGRVVTPANVSHRDFWKMGGMSPIQRFVFAGKANAAQGIETKVEGAGFYNDARGSLFEEFPVDANGYSQLQTMLEAISTEYEKEPNKTEEYEFAAQQAIELVKGRIALLDGMFKRENNNLSKPKNVMQLVEDIENLVKRYDENNYLGMAHWRLDEYPELANQLYAEYGLNSQEEIDNWITSRYEKVRQHWLSLPGNQNQVQTDNRDTPEERLAQAEAETDPNPTEAQKKAENYKQGHVTLWGLPITIENPKGSIRRGTDANGKQWEQEMHHTYGKIRRTEGVDGDHIDVFIGPNLTSDKVFVVDQRNVDTGEFDEHKCMLGFDSLEEAQNGYLSNYEEGWQGMGTVTEVTMDEFKKWIDSSHRKTKPFAEYKSVKTEGAASTAIEQPAQEQEIPEASNETLRKRLAKLVNGWQLGNREPSDGEMQELRDECEKIVKRYKAPTIKAALDAIEESVAKQKAEGAAWIFTDDEETALYQVVKAIIGKSSNIVTKNVEKPTKNEEKVQQNLQESEKSSTFAGVNNNQNGNEQQNNGGVSSRSEGESGEDRLQQSGLGRGDRASQEDIQTLKELLDGKAPDEQQKIARQWAEEHGVLFDLFQLVNEKGLTDFPGGNENSNWIDKQAGVIYKMNNLMNSKNRISVLLERVALYNQLFPETRLDFVGLATVAGGRQVYPVYSQVFVAESRNASVDEIKESMHTLGFEPTEKTDGEFSNEQYIIGDARPRNVLVRPDNKVVYVDVDVTLAPQNEPAPTKPTRKQEQTTSQSGANNSEVVSKQQPAQQKAEPKNTIFTDEAYEAAKARMKARLNRLNMGVDPEAMIDEITIAGYHIERGVRKFADFARELIKEFGDGIRERLKPMYNYFRDIPEGRPYRDEMDHYDTVMAFDLDAITAEEEQSAAVEEEPEHKYDAGDKVIYKGHNCIVTEVQNDGTYIIEYPNALGINVKAIGIAESDLEPAEYDRQKVNRIKEQYDKIKEQYPDATLLFRVGDFYELYKTDAEEASKILAITLTHSNIMGENTPMAGFPFHALDKYLPMLVRAGKRVAICDQLEDPKKAKGLVKRGVTELVTPGVPYQEEAKEEKDDRLFGTQTTATHTKTGAEIIVVKPYQRVENFAEINALARKHHGRYNTKPYHAFVFDTEEDAEAFNLEAGKLLPATDTTVEETPKAAKPEPKKEQPSQEPYMNHVYNMDDWHAAGDLRPAEGQEVVVEIIETLRGDGMPTTDNSKYFQAQEPYSHDRNGKPLYKTFEKIDGKWFYRGIMPDVHDQVNQPKQEEVRPQETPLEHAQKRDMNKAVQTQLDLFADMEPEFAPQTIEETQPTEEEQERTEFTEDDVHAGLRVRLKNGEVKDIVAVSRSTEIIPGVGNTKAQLGNIYFTDGTDCKFEDIEAIHVKDALTPKKKVEEKTAAAGGNPNDPKRIFAERVSGRLLDALASGDNQAPFSSILDLRKLAREVGLQVDENGKDDIMLKELVEDGIVQAARKVIASGQYGGSKSKTAYDAIVRLYEMQPSIQSRSSNSIAMAQFSTPIPMGFVADMFAYSPDMKTVLEPTAGNGMLVFAIPAERVHANELDEKRLENLRLQGFKVVTSQDAREPLNRAVSEYDAVIANPPFGPSPAKMYDGKEISGLDPQIAINALSAMKDDGRAAIIIGGNMEYADNGSVKDHKAFWTYLYDHYNVKGVVDMDGELYRRQGTTYDVRMILIDGRRSEAERAQTKVIPPVQSKAVAKVKTFDELYDTVLDLLHSNIKTNGNEVLRTQSAPLSDNSQSSGQSVKEGHRGESNADVANGQRSGRENGSQGTQQPSKRGVSQTPATGASNTARPTDAGVSQPKADTGVNAPAAASDRPSVGDNGRVQSEPVQSVRTPADRVGLTPKPQEKRNLTAEKLSYRPHSQAFSLQSVAPAAMVEAMDKVLAEIEHRTGKSIDQFVADELGYDSVQDAHNALAAEQMDSVAMAIYQMYNGMSLIIGDQTGVGKGRQMAALIRWAVQRGKKPIFITQKADLFSDIYRDLVDIGSGDLRPFIFNSDGAMVNSQGETVHRPLSAAEQRKVFESGVLPDEYDFAVLTYSQVNTGDEISRQTKNKDGYKIASKKTQGRPSPKADFLRQIANDNYLFLDESHTAAGDSNIGAYIRSIIGTKVNASAGHGAKGVTFASATFAKRPDTMPMYALRTAMSAANVEQDKLIEIIEKGGVTLQEIMSRALTESGQMVRRERDMSDVQTDWKTIEDPEIVRKAREQYDRTITAFNAIIDFQTRYITPLINEKDLELAAMMETVSHKKGTKSMGIDNTPFASKTYNYTKQLMLALKVDAIVAEVEKEIKALRHPVIALESTMEASIKDYAPGDIIEEPTFSASLLRGLDSCMQYTITDEDGKEVHGMYSPAELGPEGEAAYYRLQEFIRESTKDIFISPLDAIIEGLKAKGYRVGELTGRNTYVERDSNGKVVVRRRTDKDKISMTRAFNSGALDVLILNKSASTGISLHASKTFADQRQRSMIIAQPLSDINDYMQMIGRIDRTGQVHRGYYINLGLPVPAESRFLMMLSTKLKSLNANTTTSQDSESNEVDAPDLLNKYGSQVVIEYLRDNPTIYEKIGEPLKGGNGTIHAEDLEEYKPSEDDALKITGRVALLSTKEQEEFYQEVVRRYNDLIRYLNDTGMNDLKITTMPLRAKTLARKVSSEGKDPNGTNPFAGNAYVEKVEMDVLRKPMKADEVRKLMEQLNGNDSKARIDAIWTTINTETKEKADAENERYAKAMERVEKEVESFAAKVNANEKLSAEDKQRLIEGKRAELAKAQEDKHNANNAKIQSMLSYMRKALFDMFSVGHTYLVPDDLEAVAFNTSAPAIFCGFKAKDSKITPSTTFAVFATLDGRRKVEIKLTELPVLNRIHDHTMENYDAARQTTLDNWDTQIPTQTRKEGYIMTGNILQAVSDSQDQMGNYPGQLVSYTDIDGNVHDGILMPDKWEPGQLRNAGAPIAARFEQMKHGTVTSADGKVTIRRGWGAPDFYYLDVPKSRKEGGQYYLNKDILPLVEGGEFYTSHGQMEARVPAENMPRVLDILSNLGVKAQPEANERAEFSITNLDYPQFRNQTEAQQLATAALVEVLNDNTDLDVFLATDEEAQEIQTNTGEPETNTPEFGFRTDRDGNPIGDGDWHMNYFVREFPEYPQISSRVDKSVTTESVYVTYTNADNGRSVKVRFSGHRSNAERFGDVLTGGAPRGEILYRLGLATKEWQPFGYVPIGTISNKQIAEGNYEVADKTRAELERLPKGTDISEYKGKLVPGEPNRIYTGTFVGESQSAGIYIYKDANGNEIRGGLREAMRTPNGTLYGWAIGDRIYLTKDGLNPNSPIHEYSHIWAKAMMRNNREGWQSIVDIFKGTPFWDEVVNDPNYQGLTTDDAICSEVLARYSGQRGAARMEEWAKEEQYEAEQSGSVLRGAKVRQLINRAKKALADFWHWVGVNLFGIKHFDSAKQVAERVLWDMLNGTELDVTADREMQHIKERAIADGTFMKAPKGQPTNLNERQWLQVRTRAFKRWFGDWENDPQNASKVVDANGEPMVVYHGTPNPGFTTFGRTVSGIYFADEDTASWYSSEDKPRTYRNAPVFKSWDEVEKYAEKYDIPFEKANEEEYEEGYLINDEFAGDIADARNIIQSYRVENELAGSMYACFLNIRSPKEYDYEGHGALDGFRGKEEPAVYFERLQQSQYGRKAKYDGMICRNIKDFGNFLGGLAEVDEDGRLEHYYDNNIYIVSDPNQIKSATDNNGEFSEDNDNIEMMISGYTQEKQRIINEWYAAHPRPQYQVGEKLEHYRQRLEAYQEEEKRFREQLQAHRPSNASASTEQSERISQNQAPAFVPGVRPTPMANETPYEYALRLRQYYQLMRDERLVAEYVAEINNQADAAAKVLKKNTIVRGLLDAAKPIENFQEWMKQRGATITDESNAYTDTFLATGRVTEANEQMQRDIIRPLAKQIAKIIAPDAKTGKSRLDGINIVWHNMDVAGTGSKLDGKALTPREIIGVYCQAKDCAEAIEKGLPDRGAKGFLNNLGMSHDDVIAAVESVIPRAELDELWRLINAATHFALNYDYESGRISEDTHTEFYQREFYVPQRGWRERDESGLITEYEPVGKRGNDPYNAALVKAHGRQSLASDPFAYIMSIDASSIVSSENNKIKQKFLQFCLDNENLGLQTGAFRVKKYWIMNVIDPETGKIKLDEEGNPMMEVSYVAPSAEDLSHDRTIKELIKKKRKEWAKVNQAYLERQSHGELGPQLEAAYKTKLSKIEQSIEDLEQQMHIAWNATNTNITQRTSDEKKQHEVRVLLDGQEYLIEVQDEKLANAINKKFKQHQEQLFNTSQKMRNATRFMSAVLTQYNPEFAASNFARDFQVALATLTAEHPELVGSFLKNFAACQPAVWQYAFNDKVRDRAVFRDSELGRYLQEYFKAGAATGFSYMQDLKSLRQDFDAMVNESNLRRGIKGAVGTLSMLTEVSETAVRFAGYVSARQKGMGINEAAYLSKELTTNFDRAGEVADSGWMSWFSFFRATLNGNIKFLKALKKMPLAYSLIAAAYVAMGMLNQFLNPDDPEDEVWAGDYTRESNFVIGKWRIPTAHFLRMFFAAGVNAAKWIQGEKSFGEATYNTATFATNELLPDYLDVMNWTDWDSDTGRMTMPWDGDNYKKGVRGFIPTPLSPIADVWANRDFMGATINYPADDGKKDILRAKKKTLPIYQMITQTIYEGVGGNMNTKRKSDDPAWRSWLFDTSASSVEHVVEGYMPAGMDMFITLGEAIYDAATGTPTGPDKWPFVRKFYNAYTPERAYMQQYYLLNGRVKEFKRNMDDYRKNDRTKYNILTHSQEYRNYQEAERLVKKQKENPTTADVQALINANKQWIK